MGLVEDKCKDEASRSVSSFNVGLFFCFSFGSGTSRTEFAGCSCIQNVLCVVVKYGVSKLLKGIISNQALGAAIMF